MQLYALVFFLAFFTETIVEYILGTPMDKIAQVKPFKWCLMYASAVVGVLLAFFYRLDVVAELYGEATWVGMVITGLAVGRGSNFVHDLWAKHIRPSWWEKKNEDGAEGS